MLLTGRWRSYAWTGAAFLVIILGILGEWGESYSFCSTCGLRRTRTGLRLAGILPLEWPAYTGSSYHRLYRRFVADQCVHDWRLTSYGWTALGGGGVACGAGSPVAFRDKWSVDEEREVGGKQLAALERLSDPQKVRVVLLALANEGGCAGTTSRSPMRSASSRPSQARRTKRPGGSGVEASSRR